MDRWPSAAHGNGFKTVADKVHAMGLKFGIHIMRGMPSLAVVSKSPIKGTSEGETCDDVAIKSVASGDGPGACPWYPGAISVDVNKTAGKLYYDSLYEMVADWGCVPTRRSTSSVSRSWLCLLFFFLLLLRPPLALTL